MINVQNIDFSYCIQDLSISYVSTHTLAHWGRDHCSIFILNTDISFEQQQQQRPYLFRSLRKMSYFTSPTHRHGKKTINKVSSLPLLFTTSSHTRRCDTDKQRQQGYAISLAMARFSFACPILWHCRISLNDNLFTISDTDTRRKDSENIEIGKSFNGISDVEA